MRSSDGLDGQYNTADRNMEALKSLVVRTLNGDPGVKITEHIFVGSKASWDEIGGIAPQFDTDPPTK